MPKRQIATLDGLYRCTGLGETKFCKPGKALPICHCKGGGSWEFLKEDNMEDRDAVPIIIIGNNIFFETDELPEIDHCYNIRGPSDEIFKPGKYIVTAVDEDYDIGTELLFGIFIKYVGDIDNYLPIHNITGALFPPMRSD